MGNVVWCVTHDYSEGHSVLLKDRYGVPIRYDDEGDALKLAYALISKGYNCRAVPIDLSVEDI